jgi:ABC-2 type transport system ATP-binding protein
MIELCGLGVEQHKKIEALSKGYRQRTGLAQALLHDPSVLILDEPTSGLDPNQIVEIRNVIKEVSRNKTVLFSTHILQEVEAMCDRVLVISRGVLVADDQLARLRARKTSVARVRVEFNQPVDLPAFRSLPGITHLQEVSQGVYIVESNVTVDVRPAVFRFAADHQLSLVGLQQQEDSLEAMFHSLTTSATHA